MFKPKIIGFVCNWSLPAWMDVPSQGTIPGYPKIRIVRVLCVGGIDPTIVLETFFEGADGVLIIGCNPSDCHFVAGNLQIEWKTQILKKLISLVGLDPERLRSDWTYPFEIERLAKIINDFKNQVTSFGPSPLAEEKGDANILENILAAKNAVADFRLRAFIGKETELTRSVNAYGERFSGEEFNTMLDEVIKDEFIRQKILLMAKKKSLSVKELSQTLNMKPAVVLRHILNMRRRGIIALDSTEGTTPLYKALEVP